MRTRRKYSQEYKQEAVQLVQQYDVSLTQVASNLGINANMLARWCKEYSNSEKRAFSGQGNSGDQEMAQLKRE